MRVKCPTCRKSVQWDPANPWRPFCCERCRLIDLGEWVAERHAIPGEPATELPPDTASGPNGRSH